MSIQDPFSPSSTALVLAASVASASGVLPGVDGQQLSVTNGSATGVASVALGFGAAPTATGADGRAVAPMSYRVFSIPIGVTHVAVILDASTGNVSLQRGYGE